MNELNINLIYAGILILFLSIIFYNLILNNKDKKILGGNKSELELENVIDNQKNIEDLKTKVKDINDKIKYDDNELVKKEQKYQNILQDNDESIKIDNNKELSELLKKKTIDIKDIDDYTDEDIKLWDAELDKFMPSDKELDEWTELFENTITINNKKQKGGKNDIEIPGMDEIDKELSDEIIKLEKYLYKV
tara:strand:- start:886 stop:1461 length:576 start_codon:yes stop_codon:yes gene_type:complete